MLNTVVASETQESKRRKLSGTCFSVARDSDDLVRNSASTQQKLLVDKYMPSTLSALVGNTAKINSVKEWLSNWRVKLNSKVRSNQHAKSILISGPPGVGKTTTARLVCQELGYDFVEVNASDARNRSSSLVGDGLKSNLISAIKEMITNSSIKLTNTSKNIVLIMDEVDGMSGGDRGGVTELISIIKSTKIPIICICNDRYSPKLKSLLNHCEECVFQRPLRPQLVKYVAEIAKKEGITLPNDYIVELVESCERDIRLLLNQLQLLQIKGNAGCKRFGDSSVKDVPGNLFGNVEKLFDSGNKCTIHLKERQALADADLMPLLVQENYINMRPITAGNDHARLQLLSTAACRVSDGDVLSRAVHVDQQWSLLALSIVSGSILPASIVSGKRELLSPTPGERNFHRFPALLGKTSSRTKVSKLCSELSSHFANHTPCAATSKQIRLECFPLIRVKTLRDMAFAHKGGLEHEGIQSVLSFMVEYNLNRADWDTLHDVTLLAGKGPLFQHVSELVCSKVKAAFTRNCNKTFRV